MKRKSKKRQIKNKKKEGMTPTKFWEFISFGLIVGFLVGALISGTFTGSSLIDWNIEEEGPFCTDTDGGFNIRERGICNDGTGNLVDRCIMMGIHRVLFEYECIENKCVRHEIYCEDYCQQTNPAYQLCYLGACNCE